MLSNLVVPLSNVDGESAICTLCGLMCDLSLDCTNRCDRRNRWISLVPPRSRETVSAILSERLFKTKLDARSLIWLDSCDVQTTRAAVQLARRLAATVHVGQSTGSHAVKNVMASEGWLGTTLSEIAARSELVITIGDGLRSESPLVAERFFHSQTQSNQPYWLHISQHAEDHDLAFATNSPAISPNEVIRWPRDQWFDRLSQLALILQQPELSANASSSISQLSARLLAAKQSIWMWDVDDMHFQSDELTVRRMLSIARTLSDKTRCALLPLDLNIGRVTAEETLLWLTGCPTTATWSGESWYRSPRFADYSLEQWSAAFSSIILVSNLASDRSLPNLPADITIQTSPVSQAHEVQVAAVGRDCSGHLFRGDRGVVLFAEATSKSELPTAAQLLMQLLENAVVN